MAVVLMVLIALFFVGSILIFITSQYEDTPTYAISQRGTVIAANRDPQEVELQINQSAMPAGARQTQFAHSPRQGSHKTRNHQGISSNKQPIDRPHPAPPSTRVAARPVTAFDDDIEAEKQSVLRSIESWRTAWRDQDVETYIALYSDAFQPDNGGTHQAWLKERHIKLEQTKSISVLLDHLQVERLDDHRWKATFYQHYRSLPMPTRSSRNSG